MLLIKRQKNSPRRRGPRQNHLAAAQRAFLSRDLQAAKNLGRDTAQSANLGLPKARRRRVCNCLNSRASVSGV